MGDYTIEGRDAVVMSLKAARASWIRLKAKKDDPTLGDPVAAIREQKKLEQAKKAKERATKVLTMGWVIDTYLEEKIEKNRKAKGVAEVTRLLSAPAVQKIRKIPVGEFDRKAAKALIQKVAAGQSKKPAPRVASMTRQELRAAWAYAEEEQEFKDLPPMVNPFRGDVGGKFDSKERQRWLSDDEVVTLLRWMRTPGAYSRTVADALELILRTGLRPGEACGIHTSELQRRGGVLWLDIPEERMKEGQAHSIPLVGRAEQIVLTRVPDKPGYIFAGRKGAIAEKVLGVEVYSRRGTSSAEAYKNKRICPVENFAPHDLRRTARQLLARIRCPVEIGETILAHRLTKVQRTYLDTRGLPEQLVEWVTRLNEHIDTLQPAEPVLLHRAA